MYELDPNQNRAVHYALNQKWSFNCMNMGEGKTFTALEAAVHAGAKRVTIVCPAYLRSNWEDEIAKFYANDPPFSYYIISYASKSAIQECDFLVLDEFHYLKNPQSQRTNKVWGFLSYRPPKYVLGLSGTPMKNTAADFYPYFKFLKLKHTDLKFPENYYKFQHVFCNKVANNFIPTGYGFEGVNPENKERLKDIVGKYFYFTPKELRPKLPDTINKNYVGDKGARKTQLMEEAIEAGRSAEYMAIKAFNAEKNVSATYKIASDLIEQGFRPVVFTEHRLSAIALARKFKTKPVIGGVSNSVRSELLDQFDQNITSILVGTYGAMGTGLNITSSNHMIFNDYCFSPSDYDQARKRIHRKGQDKTCFYHHVFLNEVDHQIFRRLVKKKIDSDEMHRR